MISAEEEAAGLARSVRLDCLDVSDVDRFRDGTHLPFFARLRNEDPVHFCAESPYGSYWSITRAADVTAVNSDHRGFSSHRNVIIGDIPESFPFPAFMVSDPPQHGKWRRVVSPVMSRSALSAMEARCRQGICDLLDDLPRDDTFDWVDRVSRRMTRWMVGALFDLKEDAVDRLVSWSDYLMMFEADGREHPAHHERRLQLQEFEAFLTGLAAERADRDASRGFIAALVNGPHGADMTDDTAHFMGTVSLLVGANETTRSAVSAAIVAMNRYPAQWELLRRRPELVPEAAQEVIRWQTPLAHMRRTATQDIEFRGKRIKAGQRVVMWYCSANRDADLFADADAFDITRPNARQHLSYGYGIHRCVGRHVAEMQLRLLLEEMLRRYRTVSLVETPRRTRSNYFAGFESVSVQLERKAST